MTGFTVTKSFHIAPGRRRQNRLREGDAPKKSVAPGRLPRISRLMALAIHIEQLVADGTLRDYAEAARLGHVTRARISQIMNLINLAPEIQEQILFLPRVEHGHDPISEHDLRPIAANLNWRTQRRQWRDLLARTSAARHTGRNGGARGRGAGGGEGATPPIHLANAGEHGRRGTKSLAAAHT